MSSSSTWPSAGRWRKRSSRRMSRSSAARAAGFDTTDGNCDLMSFHNSIAAAERQARVLADLTEDLERCHDREALLAVVRDRVREIIPYDAMAIYARRDEHLVPDYVDGDDYRLFAALEIPLGMGLSGWVAENGKSIINGNPSVEPGYLNDPTKFSTLRSALAVPLERQRGGVTGVLSLYRQERDAFTTEHLTLLLAISAKLARVLEGTGERVAR